MKGSDSLMFQSLNDVVIEVATVNGSGSQTSNNILLRALFRMGIPVGGKNLFPSNIAGLPTWFTIRAHHAGHTSRKEPIDVYVALNPSTIADDVRKVRPGGVFIYDENAKPDVELWPTDLIRVPVNFRTLVSDVTDSIRLKKLLANMIYVGLLAEWMNIDSECLHSAVRDQFQGKENLLDTNLKAIEVGRQHAQTAFASEFTEQFPHRFEKIANTEDRILIDGNSAAALGLLMGGCTFLSWYPITPSSSLAEGFGEFAARFRTRLDGQKNYAIIQAEDELSAISMVAGAGWAGARAATATSGPGLSLMSEAAGLFYFSEIPGVIWNVQRAGPSTGLPTRTLQGDLLASAHLSHGDTEHIVLLPASPKESFDFGQQALDLAEVFQTLVIVLSDLDLGMNFWTSPEFSYPETPFQRGKVLSAEDLDKIGRFERYADTDGDGIPYRTLPGTEHDLAAYFTRGSGHNEKGEYSERPADYEKLLKRLQLKMETARKHVPQALIDEQPGASIGLIAYGTSDAVMAEARENLLKKELDTSYLRVRALPLPDEIGEFIDHHDRVYVIEQNRDGQMLRLLQARFPDKAPKLSLIAHYNGLPLMAETVETGVLSRENLL